MHILPVERRFLEECDDSRNIKLFPSMQVSLSEAERAVFASNKQTSSRGKTACLTRLQPVQSKRQQHNNREAIILLFMVIPGCPWCDSVISQELTVDKVQRFGSQCMSTFYLWCLSVVKLGPSLSHSLRSVMWLFDDGRERSLHGCPPSASCWWDFGTDGI